MSELGTLSEDQKKMLEGLTCFNVNSTVMYVAKPHTELPSEIRPEFKLRPFKKLELDRVRKLLSNVKESDESELREFARLCIQGFNRLYDAGTGELVEYVQAQDGGLSKDIFSTIPIVVVTDILLYVSRISGILPPEHRSL
jgi:hypothetical protein